MIDSIDFENGPWKVTIEPYERWGPFAWHITASRGLFSGGYRFAWTERGAERKARRLLRNHEAVDRRKATKTRVLVGSQEKQQ